MFGVDAFTQARCIGRTAFQREVFTAYRDSATVDGTKTHDIVRRSVFQQLVVIIVHRTGGCPTVLTKRTVIKQHIDTLADGHAASRMLLGDTRLATLLLRQIAPSLQLFDFVFPTHDLRMFVG